MVLFKATVALYLFRAEILIAVFCIKKLQDFIPEFSGKFIGLIVLIRNNHYLKVYKCSFPEFQNWTLISFHVCFDAQK